MPSPRPATRQCAGQPRGLWPLAASDSAAARGISRATIRVRWMGASRRPGCSRSSRPESVEYVVGMPSNTRLEKRARRLMGKARMRSKATGRTEHLYGRRATRQDVETQATGDHQAEVVRHPGRDPKRNPRFLVTTCPTRPRRLRGDLLPAATVENRLKELHHGLEMDRTSCSRFLANQFRVLLSLAAYLLFQELQRRARGTAARMRRSPRCATADQARRLGRALGAPHCAALARDLPMAPDLASACARRRRDLVTRSANQRRGGTPDWVSSRDPCGALLRAAYKSMGSRRPVHADLRDQAGSPVARTSWSSTANNRLILRALNTPAPPTHVRPIDRR